MKIIFLLSDDFVEWFLLIFLIFSGRNSLLLNALIDADVVSGTHCVPLLPLATSTVCVSHRILP